MGNHEELLANYPDGTYSSFCKKQENAEANKIEATASKLTESELKQKESDGNKMDALEQEMKTKIDAKEKEE